MIFKTGQKIARYSWYEIPMPGILIDLVNTLGGDQPEHFTFRDSRGRLIVEFDLIGLDEEPTETPQQIKKVEYTDLKKSDAVN